MSTSKAHAVQTSAHASMPVEPDMFADESDGTAVVGALRFAGCLVDDSRLDQKSTAEGLIPEVSFSMRCTLGAVTFIIQARIAYTPATCAAAGAKAAHCRKGTWVELDADHVDVRLVLPHCKAVRVLEGQPQ